eukprot:scaffold5460_cov153-Skeletonema_dohrnii-CCMP3373.AAC.19
MIIKALAADATATTALALAHIYIAITITLFLSISSASAYSYHSYCNKSMCCWALNVNHWNIRNICYGWLSLWSAYPANVFSASIGALESASIALES